MSKHIRIPAAGSFELPTMREVRKVNGEFQIRSFGRDADIPYDSMLVTEFIDDIMLEAGELIDPTVEFEGGDESNPYNAKIILKGWFLPTPEQLEVIEREYIEG